jgi:hypothetical protein
MHFSKFNACHAEGSVAGGGVGAAASGKYNAPDCPQLESRTQQNKIKIFFTDL